MHLTLTGNSTSWNQTEFLKALSTLPRTHPRTENVQDIDGIPQLLGKILLVYLNISFVRKKYLCK